MTYLARCRLSITVLTLGLTGCQREIANTEGEVLSVACTGSNCTVTKPSEGANSPDEPLKYAINKEGRILTACPQEGSPFDCRPLRCESGTICAQLGGPTFECEKALCQAPKRSITPKDRTALCLATTGKWQRQPLQLERVTLSRACRGTCQVPAACLPY